MQNKIVLHYLDGRIFKGSTNDFSPHKPWFYFADKESGELLKVDFTRLKGVFFVRDFEGAPRYRERYDIGRKGYGRKIKVSFFDGETIVGYTSGVSPGRVGFFLFPSDPHSNTQKVFAMVNATREILFETS